jgi:hypothetical protein
LIERERERESEKKWVACSHEAKVRDFARQEQDAEFDSEILRFLMTVEVGLSLSPQQARSGLT